MLEIKDALLELFKSFYLLTGIIVGMFDSEYNVIAHYPPERTDFCSLIRENDHLRALCTASDVSVFQKCARTKSSRLYRCHMNLYEYCVPMIFENTVIGFIMMGRFLDESDGKFSELISPLMENGIDLGKAAERFFSIPKLDMDRISSAAKILETCASYMYQKRLIEIRTFDLPERIEKYVIENISADLSVMQLCKYFAITRTEIYDIFSRRFGMGVADYVRERRLGYAMKLIEETDLPIHDISSQSGFSDYNYFSRVFKKYYGISASAKRKVNRYRARQSESLL